MGEAPNDDERIGEDGERLRRSVDWLAAAEGLSCLFAFPNDDAEIDGSSSVLSDI